MDLKKKKKTAKIGELTFKQRIVDAIVDDINLLDDSLLFELFEKIGDYICDAVKNDDMGDKDREMLTRVCEDTLQTLSEDEGSNPLTRQLWVECKCGYRANVPSSPFLADKHKVGFHSITKCADAAGDDVFELRCSGCGLYLATWVESEWMTNLQVRPTINCGSEEG